MHALLGALLAASSLGGSAWAATPARPDIPQFTLQTKLFYSRSGNFSGDMLQAGGPPPAPTIPSPYLIIGPSNSVSTLIAFSGVLCPGVIEAGLGRLVLGYRK